MNEGKSAGEVWKNIGISLGVGLVTQAAFIGLPYVKIKGGSGSGNAFTRTISKVINNKSVQSGIRFVKDNIVDDPIAKIALIRLFKGMWDWTTGKHI